MNNQYILPTQCKKCGAVFDLYYEFLEANERIESEDVQEKIGSELAESLCWGCKRQLLTLLTPSQKQKESSGLDEFFMDLNVEFE